LYRNLRLSPARREWGEIDAVLTRASQGKDNVDGVLLAAEIRAGKGDLAGARTVLDERLAGTTDPRARAALWCALAEMAYRQEREAEAEKLLSRGEQELGDRLEVRLARCRLWSARGSSDDRRRLVRLGENLDAYTAEDRLRLWRELADAWQRLGDRDQAARLWTEIARAQPGDLRSRFALVELAVEAGQESEARRHLADLRSVEGEGPLARFGSAALKVRLAHSDPARLAEPSRELEDLQRKYPRWGRVPLLLARIDERTGQLDAAAHHYLDALELGEARPAVVVRLLELLIERRDYPRAEEALKRYAQQQLLTRDLIRLAAEVAVGNQNERLALERARLAAPLPSRDYRDYLWLAQLEQRSGEPKEAEEHLQAALQLADYVPDVWVALITHLGATGRASAAEPLLAELKTKLTPDVVPLTLARCLDALHQAERAAEAYQHALAARPNDTSVLAAAAEFYYRAGRDAEAEPLLRRLLEPKLEAPGEYVVRARRRLAALLAGRDLDAGHDTSRVEALEFIDANRRAYGSLAADERLRLYIRSTAATERPGAVTEFRASLTRQAPTPDEQVMLARLYEADGKLTQARDELNQVISLAGRTPEYLARLVRVLIRNEELEEAARQLNHLEALEPSTRRTQDLRQALRQARIAASN
jgi:tetratricopeptide (TPR) repeat protein